MHWTIAGLGNPGEEYRATRHNVGFQCVEAFRAAKSFPEWKNDRRGSALVSSGEVSSAPVRLILPQTYMNHSGRALAPLIKTPGDLGRLIVIHDELDLPLGTFRLAFDRGSGGHRGVASVIDTLKSKAFIRVRIGITPLREGILAKPQGEADVLDFLMAPFGASERRALEALYPKITEVLEHVVLHGYARAMNTYNAL